MRNKVVIGIFLFICVCLMLYFIPWRESIDTTIAATQYRIGDVNYSEDVTISITGKYSNFLFKDDKFVGSISIDKYEFTNDSLLSPCNFSRGYTTLFYKTDSNSLSFLGMLISKPDFDQFVITVFEPIEESQQEWNGLFITSQAITRVQAIKNVQELTRKNLWFSDTIWE